MGDITNQVESYGKDECWCDVSGSRTMFGDGMAIADEIRETVKASLGLPSAWCFIQ
jgi:DNA polymerase-4